MTSHETDLFNAIEQLEAEFEYDAHLRTPLLGRNIREIEESGKLSVLGRCPDEALIAGYRLNQHGIPSTIVLQNKKGTVKFRFLLEAKTVTQTYTLNFAGGKIRVKKRTHSKKRG
ncbi:MAG: hypothetical protein COV47_03795 [Candidatus Diapherotrites archaeon CG11_big_fil_rev_8_21_14_0_20_37_9]|nr:MAG: hypothetical protein COV47_03795 [Candidatus Diapherotrites archaeon CG11_big_fil_rev_8_21_14_0_20_37_9]